MTIDFAAHAAITSGTKNLPTLEDWSIGLHPEWKYDLTTDHLYGYVFGDSRWPDGSPIITTEIVFFYWEGRIAKTRHSVYRLGEPCQNFMKMLAGMKMRPENLDRGYHLSSSHEHVGSSSSDASANA